MSSVDKNGACSSLTLLPTCAAPTSAASHSLWFCDFGFHSGAGLGDSHSSLSHPGGTGDDVKDEGRKTVASPETSCEQETFFQVHTHERK